MRKLYLLLFSVFLLNCASAQMLIPDAAAQTQNFDGMGSAATATLPTGFRVSQSTDYALGTSATTLAYGTSGSGAVTSSSGGGVINWGNGATATATDRSLGFLSTGSFSSPRSLMLEIQNTSGSPITSLTITFDYEKYRSGTRAFDFKFYSGTNGSTWTSQSTGDQSYTSDGGNTVVNPPTTISKSVTITGLSILNNGKYYLRWEYTGVGGSTNGQGLGLDNVSITATLGSASSPALSASVASVSSLNYFSGAGPSASQSFTVTGSNLGTNNVSVSPGGTNFEIATADAGPYQTTPITLVPDGSGAVNQAIYVRLAAGLSEASYNSTVTISSSGATSQNVTLAGVVAATPVITPNPGSLSGFTTVQGTASASQSFTVNGSNLTGNITVSAPADFEVSTDNTSFFSTRTLNQAAGIVNATVYARVKSNATLGPVSGNITLASSSATTQNVAVSGTVNAGPSLSATPASLTGFTTTQGTASGAQTISVAGTNLTTDITVTAPAGYEVSGDAATYGNTLTLTPSGGTVNSTTVHVRIKSTTAAGTANGNLTVTSTGATTQTISLSGNVTLAPAMPFTQNNLVVYRVGDGSASLSGSATAAFIDEINPLTGATVQTIALPTSTSGGNARITAAGTSTTEAYISRSWDGRYLLVLGYDAAVGTASVAGTTSASVPRVVGRIAADGSINSTTALTDYASGSSPRGVASIDGANFWLTSGVQGVRYAALGSSTSSSVSTTTTNLRGITLAGGQLYISTASGSTRIGMVGSGMPNTPGQTISALPGIPTTLNPNQFFFADLDATEPGVDVVYMADDQSSGGGFHKYSLVSGTWVSNGNIAVTGNGLRGLTGVVNGSTVTLYGTSPGTIFSLTDASGYNAAISGTVNTLATAAANTGFRGIAFTPQNFPLPVRFTNIRAQHKAGGVQVEWSNSTETDVVSYSLEHSTTGRQFTSIAQKTPTRNDGGQADYQVMDTRAIAGDNFYRVKAVESNGKITYCPIVRINISQKGIPSLQLYPNPVKGNEISLQFSNLPAGPYSIRVYNNAGQMIQQHAYMHAGGSAIQPYNLAPLRSGIYHIQVSGNTTLKSVFVVE